MKAIVFRGVGDIGLEEVPEPAIEDPHDAVVRLTASAICGTDLHFVRGAGPVGQFAIEAARRRDAARVIAVDRVQDRLEMARDAGAEIVDFDREDPVGMIQEMTRGIGVDRVVDAVGVDADQPAQGPGAHRPETRAELQGELGQVSREARDPNGHWGAGDAPSQALRWSVDAVAKAGTIGIIGVYPPTADRFPIGAAMNRNLTVHMGNCNHRRYVPGLVRLVETGSLHPEELLTRQEPVASGVDAYRQFDQRRSG